MVKGYRCAIFSGGRVWDTASGRVLVTALAAPSFAGAVAAYRKDGCARATVTTSAPMWRATALMWRVIAAGSDTAIFCGLTLPLGACVTTEARKLRWSAKWFGADTRLSGSREIVFRYQLKSALPSSPREFLGCGVWFVSMLATAPTFRTERPR